MPYKFGAMSRSTHDGHHVRQRQDGCICTELISRPFFYVFFRPKEVDTASGRGPILRPLYWKMRIDPCHGARTCLFSKPRTKLFAILI